MGDDSKNLIPDINTDNREPFDWQSRYPDCARKRMRIEAIYIFSILFSAFTILFLNYMGKFSGWLCLDRVRVAKFEYMIYFSSAGLLGGIVFGMKYFYRVIARGYWTQDRVYWRILSPFISMCVAFIVGSMVSAGILNSQNSLSNAWAIAYGFLSGYLADDAVSKMCEIAASLFGKSKKE